MFLQNKSDLRTRLSYVTSLAIFLGLVLVLLTGLFFQVVVVSAPTEDNIGVTFLVRFLQVFGAAGTLLFIYSLFRISRKKTGRGDSKDSPGKTGFVMNTFEGLIQELKSKEEELERLKKVAEDRAKRIEGHNENILQSVPSGVLTVDREKKITTFNTAAGTILALPPELALGESYESLFLKNPKMMQLLDRTLEEERDMLRQDCAVEQSPGKKIWLGLSTSLLRDRNGGIIGATLVFTDLTEKKMLEEQVELKKRLAMMGEMSAWVAHEFRSYMGTILGFSRLLEKKLEQGDPKKSMIKSITSELSSMEYLISELLSYSKKTVVEPSPIILTEMLQRLVRQFQESGQYPHITWEIDLEADFPEIKLDSVLMRQAFTNLIQNALDVMPEAGQLKMRAFRRPAVRRVQIEISDTGPGIPEDALDKVFLPFFTTKNKGTGLGLALVHKIILSHNGHIMVANNRQKGARFTVILPVNRGQVILKEPEWKQF